MEFAPAQPHHQTLAEYIIYFGLTGPTFLLAAVVLTIWLWVLSVRTRPLSEYVAYLATTLYPLFFGILGSIQSVLHGFYFVGNGGLGNGPHPPTYANLCAQLVGEVSIRLIVGVSLTGLFLAFGILALLIRRPQ